MKVVQSLGSTNRVVMDLRYYSAAPERQSTWWLGAFTPADIALRATYRRVHEGFNEFNDSGSTYRQRWQVEGGDSIRPLRNRSGRIMTTAPSGVLFIVNHVSYNQLARELDALQRAGRAAVVLESNGCLSGPDVRKYPGNVDVQLNPIQLAGGPARPDGVVAEAITVEDFAKLATSLLPVRRTGPTTPETVVPTMRFHPDSADLSALSDRYERLFWLMKIWMGIKYFAPHLEFASVDWNAVLPNWIPRFEQATDATEFFDLVRQLTAPINDSHF